MRQHLRRNITVMLVTLRHIVVSQAVRVNPGFTAGTLKTLATTRSGEQRFGQMQTKGLAITRLQQGFYRAVLALFIVGNIAGDRMVQAFAVGEHAGQGKQLGGQRHQA